MGFAPVIDQRKVVTDLPVVADLKNESAVQAKIRDPDHTGLVLHVVVHEGPHENVQHFKLVELEGDILCKLDFADTIAVDAEVEVLL